MRIGVNAVPLRVSGGGARYVFTELMAHLLALDRRNEYIIFAHSLGLPVVWQLDAVHAHLNLGRSDAPRVRVVEVGCEDELFRHRDKFDLFFGPLNNLQPRLYDRPSVAILHDIQEQFFPQYFRESDLRARREIYPEICRAATILVTISEFCKQTIVDKFAIAPDKIEVVYNAPQAALVAREDDGAWHHEPLPEHYFFYPANCYPHKNHALLLDALAGLRAADAAAPGAVFTGFELPNGFPLRREIARRGLERCCRVYDEVGVAELRYLFRHATALVMPTQFEGFGLPAAEALACGCPVVCSDLPPLREIAGDRALYFPPNNVDALLAALGRIIADAPLRERLRSSGRQRVQRFSWPESARRMLELFDAAAQRFLDRADARPVESATSTRPAPRIGVLIDGRRERSATPAAVKSVCAAGYERAVARVLLAPHSGHDAVTEYLDAVQVPWAETELAAGDAAELLAFARDEHLDVLYELTPGAALLPTALHSLAWGWRHLPDKPMLLGEVWERERGEIVRTSRLRLLGDGLWKLEGFVYPEMLAINVAALERWPAGLQLVQAAGADWRWELVRRAHQAGQLGLLQRTLAECDPARVTYTARCRALRAGVGGTYAGNGELHGGRWLQRFKPILRPASRVLPEGWREKGKRIWRHLSNES